MKIAHVKISNVLGIAELEFTPSGFNEISGQNGKGKTSVLESIKSAIQGGHDGTLLRKGEEKGEVVLILDDGTELKKRITESKSDLTVTQDGKKVSRPTDMLKQLTDMLSVNPVDFLRAPKKDRVRVLLETMPLEADTDKLAEMTGIPVKAQPGIHALQVITAVHRQVYDDRTGTNRAIKEKDNTINQLRLALPDAPAGVTGSEDELVAQVKSADDAKAAELQRIRDKLDGVKKDNQGKIDAIRVECQRQIDEIKAKAMADVEAIQAAERDIEGKATIMREKAASVHAAAVTPLNEALAVIKSDRNNAAKREQALDTIKQMEKELEDLRSDAEAQTKAITDLDAYKAELLSSLPIPGLEVIDGEIYRDGVHFDRLNTASQVKIAVDISTLRAKDLGLICVDGLESLDSKSYDALIGQFSDSNIQVFVTRVTDSPFEINSIAKKETIKS